MNFGFQKMPREQNYHPLTQHQTCFQSLTKNAYFSSVFKSTELSVEKIFLSNNDLADGIITNDLPSSPKKMKSENSLHSYFFNPFTRCNEDIRYVNKNIIQPITAIGRDVTCLPSTGMNNENMGSWSNINLSSEDECHRIRKIKTQTGISRCNLHASKKPWFIRTLADMNVTTKNDYKYRERRNERNPIPSELRDKVLHYEMSNESLIPMKVSDSLNVFAISNSVTAHSRDNLMAQALRSSTNHQEFYFHHDRQDKPIYLTTSVDKEESAAKDTTSLQVFLGKTPGIFTHSFTPQSHSPLDYIMPCNGSHAKEEPTNQICCKTPCCRANQDGVKNLSVGTSLQGRLSPSTGVLNNCISLQDEPRQYCEVLYSRNDTKSSNENKHSISADVLTNLPSCHILQKSDLSLSYFYKKTYFFRLFDNNDESFQPRKNTFLAQLNYPRHTGERCFVYEMELSTSVASLLGTPKNEFSCFRGNSLQPTSKKATMSETVSKLCDNAMELEETEVETSWEVLDAINKNLHFLPKKALGKHYVEVGRIGYFEKYIFNTATCHSKVSECEIHDSFTERFEKISLMQNLQDYWCGDQQICDIISKEDSPMLDKVVILKNATSKHNNESLDTYRNELTERQNTTSEGKDFMVEAEFGHFSNHLEMACEMSRELSPKSAEMENWLKVKHYPADTFQDAYGMSDTSEIVDVDYLSNTKDYARILPPSEDTRQKCSRSANRPKEEEFANIQRSSDVKLHLQDISLGNRVSDKNPPDDNSSGSLSKSDAADIFSKDDYRVQDEKFEMKAQFDLVLEELRLFHTIGEKDTNNEVKDTCDHSKKSSVMYHSDLTDRSATVPENKIPLKEVSCRESSPFVDECLHSVDKKGEFANKASWKPAFLSIDRTEDTEKGCTFTLGIRRVTPLKTRPGPLRLGLSKRAKLIQLHPYLR